jgi:hypothetical protein
MNPPAAAGGGVGGGLTVSVGNVLEATSGGGPLSKGGGPSSTKLPSGLRMPAGLGSLSVEVSGATVEPGQLSISALSNAPLSAILGAFGFVSAGRDGKFGALPIPPSAGGGGGLPAFPQSALRGLDSATHQSGLPSLGGFSGFSPTFPPLSAGLGNPFSHTPLFGLDPNSMAKFVGDTSAELLSDALGAPLSAHLSHSRKSPRLDGPPGARDFKADFLDPLR